MGGSSSPRRARSSRAQTLATMVIALPAIIGAMGLAADIGNFYFNYVKVQTAADASVLSGAKYLPDQPCKAIATANMYATCLNGIRAGEVLSTTTTYGAHCPAPASTPVPIACATPVAPPGCTMPPQPRSALPACNLTMQVQRTVAYYFARLVGTNQGTLDVSATATTEVANPVGNIVPIGLQYTTIYSYGSPAALVFQPSPSGSIPAGDWGALALGGQQFTKVFGVGYSTKVSINDPVAPDRSATTAGPISAAIQARITVGQSTDPSGSPVPPPTYTANDARVVTIALVDWGAKGGCCRILGFAELWLGSVSNANISGYWVANGVDGFPDSTGTAPNDGALAIGLTQ